MSNKPTILTIAEFRKKKGKLPNPTLIYFDKTQWSNLTRDLKPERGKLSSDCLTATLIEIPGQEGGLLEAACPIECSGPLSGGEGEVHCDCSRGGEGGPGLEFAPCRLGISATGRLACLGQCANRATRCRMRVTYRHTQFGRSISLSCRCSR
jgi:hypothetical protein